MHSLYEQWVTSGESLSSFAKARGYSVSSFNYWVKKFQPTTAVASSRKIGFSKLVIDKPVCTSDGLTVITYPSGVKVEIYSAVSAGYLKELAG